MEEQMAKSFNYLEPHIKNYLETIEKEKWNELLQMKTKIICIIQQLYL